MVLRFEKFHWVLVWFCMATVLAVWVIVPGILECSRFVFA